MSILSNNTKKHTTKSRETIPLILLCHLFVECRIFSPVLFTTQNIYKENEQEGSLISLNFNFECERKTKQNRKVIYSRILPLVVQIASAKQDPNHFLIFWIFFKLP
jgi:hypothetical protein